MNIPGLTDEQVIEKYKDAVPLSQLADGTQLIGQEVDGGNHLVYVIRRNDQSVYLDYAINHVPVGPAPSVIPIIKTVQLNS